MRTWKNWYRIVCLVTIAAIFEAETMAQQPWVVYEGGSGPGSGKHIVLISGDEEYRSEEALPQLGKILAKHHGFTCTVLFAVNPDGGYIDPNYSKNIPGLDALDKADLMIIFTRFRDLPDDQMAHIDRYLMSGGPVIGMRTSTHAFKMTPGSAYEHYSNDYAGDKAEWKEGFGRLVLGEKWISHHGKHKYESAGGMIAELAHAHPIVMGIKDGDIWGPTDVYGVRLPLPAGSVPIVLGQVLEHGEVYDDGDLLYGMRRETGKPVAGEKNAPMMPIAWTKPYQIPGGKPGRAFTTTMGASTDLLSEGLRRLLVNAVYHCLEMDDRIPSDGAKVDLVGEFKPTKFEFRDNAYWEKRQMMVSEHAMDTKL